MGDLIDTTEMYLKTVLEMEEDGVTPLRARIVERLGHSGPTVSQTVSRMERDGLLHVLGDRRLELTEQGRALAVSVLRKHRLAERLLIDVIGLEWAGVHDEACRWEHVMSEQVVARLEALLTSPTADPYGNPIPSADGQGRVEASSKGRSVELAVRSAGPVRGRILRIGEPIQAESTIIEALDWAGLRPAAGVEVRKHSSDTVSLIALEGEESRAVDIPMLLTPHLFIELD